MKNNLILGVGIVLIGVGLFSQYSPTDILNNPVTVVENYVVDQPSDNELLKGSKLIVDILQNSDDSTKRSDCLKLSALYSDMATLIELDSYDKVITDTASIREANRLAGKMLRLNIKNKYEGLAEACDTLVITGIGKDDVVLDDHMRNKACEVFRALSWAFYEGSK